MPHILLHLRTTIRHLFSYAFIFFWSSLIIYSLEGLHHQNRNPLQIGPQIVIKYFILLPFDFILTLYFQLIASC